MKENNQIKQNTKINLKNTTIEVNRLLKSLVNTENVLTNIYLELGRIEKKASTSMGQSSKSVELLKKSTEKATHSIHNLGKNISLNGIYNSAKKITTQTAFWMEEGFAFQKQLSLFDVVFHNVEKNGVQTFSKVGKEATQFQNKMHDAFGTNKADTLSIQSMYQSLATSSGMEEGYAKVMSETTTKLVYDLSSFFHAEEKEVKEALKEGIYNGDTNSLLSYGIDISNTSLTPILNTLGIKQTTEELSEGERQIVRYLATLNQAQFAMGNLARTIESPSNQLKILSNQLTATKMAVSNLFIGAFLNILPYINGILMVIKEVSLCLG